MNDTPHDELVAAERLLEKLREFVAGLDDDERVLFAALLAPGVAQAYLDEEAEVAGFGMTDWQPGRLPEALVESIRTRGLRIELT